MHVEPQDVGHLRDVELERGGGKQVRSLLQERLPAKALVHAERQDLPHDFLAMGWAWPGAQGCQRGLGIGQGWGGACVEGCRRCACFC